MPLDEDDSPDHGPLCVDDPRLDDGRGLPLEEGLDHLLDEDRGLPLEGGSGHLHIVALLSIPGATASLMIAVTLIALIDLVAKGIGRGEGGGTTASLLLGRQCLPEIGHANCLIKQSSCTAA